jgi:hypothetical protein
MVREKRGREEMILFSGVASVIPSQKKKTVKMRGRRLLFCQ